MRWRKFYSGFKLKRTVNARRERGGRAEGAAGGAARGPKKPCAGAFAARPDKWRGGRQNGAAERAGRKKRAAAPPLTASVRFAFWQTRRRLPLISIRKMALAIMGNGE